MPFLLFTTWPPPASSPDCSNPAILFSFFHASLTRFPFLPFPLLALATPFRIGSKYSLTITGSVFLCLGWTPSLSSNFNQAQSSMFFSSLLRRAYFFQPEVSGLSGCNRWAPLSCPVMLNFFIRFCRLNPLLCHEMPPDCFPFRFLRR